MISDSTLDRLQESVSVADLFQARNIELEKAGREWKCRCPFHDENTSSMNVGERTYHCFGCGVKGNVFQFIQAIDGVSFIDAVKEVARRARIPAEELDFNEIQVQHEVVEKQAELLSAVIDHCEAVYAKDQGAQDYIASRGIDAITASAYRVGYDDGSLPKYMLAAGFDEKELRSMKLTNEKGNSRFWGRVIFPVIKDGRIINIYGRSIDPNNKIRHLYLRENEGVFNYDNARRDKDIFVVEAIIDALVMISNGIENVVAQFGTSGLKDHYVEALKRSGVVNAVILPDHDKPKKGQKSPESFFRALVAASKFLNAGIRARIGLIPIPGEDPASFFSSGHAIHEIEIKEPLRWRVEHTAENDVVLLARRISKLGSGPDKHKEFALEVGNWIWTLQNTTQSASGLKALLTIEDIDGKEIHKDKIDLWVAAKRRVLAKALVIDEKVVNKVCGYLEEQFKIICELDKEARQSWKRAKDAQGRLPAYAIEMAEELKQSSTLLDDIAKDITALGYVGEELNKQLLYLVGISALMPKPLGCFIASDSGAGKSAMVDTVISMFPPDMVFRISRMTNQALYYVGSDDLKHHWLIVEERQGIAQSEEADYNLRTFFSEGQLTLLRPEKDETTGHIESRRHTVYGPIAYTETTTALGIHDENATRLIELNIGESAEQTASIHDYQRLVASLAKGDVTELERKRKKIIMKHRAFISTLQPVEVRIPFAGLIDFPVHLTRARRDFLKFLGIIKAIAFLHQHQRPIEESDGVKFIDANPEDYEMAYQVAKDSIRKAFATLPERSVDLLKEILEVMKDKKTGLVDIEDPDTCSFTIKVLRDAGIKRSVPTIRNYMMPLIEHGVIETISEGQRGRGNASVFRLKVASIEEAEEAPSARAMTQPAELRKKVAASNQKDELDAFLEL